jgi:thymidylate synthase (FAD)
MNVKLIAISKPFIEGIKTAEDLVSYCARVSNPLNQLNVDTAPKLLKYCIKHEHWSPFEHASMTVEIQTSRAIAAQILRHRSFTFQEFSQRYSTAHKIEHYELRRQSEKNRQSSTDVIWENEDGVFDIAENAINVAHKAYEQLLEKGVARECARMILPLTTQTTIYMTGSLRSFIHYIALRIKEDTQKEHRSIALEIQRIFVDQFPVIAEALNWEI